MIQYKTTLRLNKKDVLNVYKDTHCILQNNIYSYKCKPLSINNNFCHLFQSVDSNELIVFHSFDPWSMKDNYYYTVIELTDFDFNNIIQKVKLLPENNLELLKSLNSSISEFVNFFKGNDVIVKDNRSILKNNTSMYRAIHHGNLDLVVNLTNTNNKGNYLPIALKIGSNIHEHDKLMISAITLAFIYIHLERLHKASYVNNSEDTYNTVGIEFYS